MKLRKSEGAALPMLLVGSMALLACQTSRAASEAQLEEHEAPPSATAAHTQSTGLQRLIDFPLLHPRITMNFRSYGFGNDFDNVPGEHTWAAGGRLGVTFPEWRDWLSVGAAAYGSFPMGPTNNPDRTLLAQRDGSSLLVAGESYLNARHGNFNLRLFRQLLDAPYLNDQDNRMIPNVFEAYTLTYKTQSIYAGFGYASRMKARNSEDYVSMAEAAGAKGSDSGVMAGGVRWSVNEQLTGHVFALYNADVFRTEYVAADFDTHLTDRTDLRLSAQYTLQSSVGDELLGQFDTHTMGLKAALGYRGAVFTLAGTTTGDDASIRSPFGQRPSYLSLMLFDFDRAAEDAWLAGVSYRFDSLGLPSWSFVLNHAEGQGARNPTTGVALDDRRETDLTVDYRPQQGALKGMWLRMRYANAEDGPQNLSQWRATLNYEFGK